MCHGRVQLGLRRILELAVLFVSLLGFFPLCLVNAADHPTNERSSQAYDYDYKMVSTTAAPVFARNSEKQREATRGAERSVLVAATLNQITIATGRLSRSFVATKPGGLNLTEASPGVYQSPGGLQYGPGSAQGHRLTHVMEHARPNASKPVHTVFKTNASSLTDLTNQVTGLVDEAWALRGAATQGGAKFVVPMGRVVGTGGQTNITVIVEAGTNKIITAFPS